MSTLDTAREARAVLLALLPTVSGNRAAEAIRWALELIDGEIENLQFWEGDE